MQILQKPISREELRSLARNIFGDMIKCVADVSVGILALDAELHADLERLLLENGSAQENLWGFNLYPPSRDVSDPILSRDLTELSSLNKYLDQFALIRQSA